MKNCLIPGCLLLLSAHPVLSIASDGVTVSEVNETGLKRWQLENNGFSLELIQLHAEFIQASYSSRGLPDPIVHGMDDYCVYGTIARNLSDGPMHYRVVDWRAKLADGQEVIPKTKSQWLDEWRKIGVRFAWSLLPDDQKFEEGDWSQGFTTVKLPRGSTFDLIYNWTLGDQRHTATIPDIECPPYTLSSEGDTQ